MKYVAAAVVLASALAGVAQADTAVKQALPKGVVTIEDVHTVVVVAKRWNAADEAALQKARANAAAQTGDKFAAKLTQGVKYAMQ